MSDAPVKAMALFAAEINAADEMADSIVKGASIPELRMMRSLLRDASNTAEAELRARGVNLTYHQFSQEGATGA